MLYHTLGWADHPPPDYTGGAVTIGNFDGVHRGHATLIAAAHRWADRVGGPAVAVTFDPPPVAVLHPAALKPSLCTLVERAEWLRAAGADRVVVLKADAGLLALSAEAFVEDILVRQLGAKAVVEGYNFRFGRGRRGDTSLLRTLCAAAGVGFEEVSPLRIGGEPVSSSRVRAAIDAGDVAAAAELLGRGYAITGTVVAGAKRGRTIGFPTANLGDVPTLVPAAGVYAVRATIDGATWPAAANVGPNPTFGESARKIEVHLIGFAGDLYGRRLTATFAAKLRDTRPFASAADLVEQLKRDVAAADRTLRGEP